MGEVSETACSVPHDLLTDMRWPCSVRPSSAILSAVRTGIAAWIHTDHPPTFPKRIDARTPSPCAPLLPCQIYTIWNFRREALASTFEAGGEAAQAASDGELALSAACLAENPKSYSAWHHRKWTVLKGLCSLDNELRLVTRWEGGRCSRGCAALTMSSGS